MWLDKTKTSRTLPPSFSPKATWMGYNSVAVIFVGLKYFLLTHGMGFSLRRWWPTLQAKESPSLAERPSTTGTGPTPSYSLQQSSPPSVSAFIHCKCKGTMQGVFIVLCHCCYCICICMLIAIFDFVPLAQTLYLDVLFALLHVLTPNVPNTPYREDGSSCREAVIKFSLASFMYLLAAIL